METFRPHLVYSFLACTIISLSCIPCPTNSHIIGDQQQLPSDHIVPIRLESQPDKPAESPHDQSNQKVSSASHIPVSSSEETPVGTAVQTAENCLSPQECTWDILTSTLTDEQLLKKALDVYLTRHGEERLQEMIARNTGLLFRGRIPASLNSVLTPADQYERIRSALNKLSVYDSVTERAESEEKVSADKGGMAHYKDMVNPGHTHVLHIEVPANLRSLENTVVSGDIAKSDTPFMLFDHSSDQEMDGQEDDMSTAPERFLIIPGRRQRPFGTRVRVMVRNKVREVRITSSPRMSVFDALKQAEKKIQYMHPELSGRRVIHIERRLTETKDGIKDCSSVTKVGRVENDESGEWSIRVSYSPGVQIVYEGRCVPSEREVNVRPATTIDLIFTPFTTSGQQHSSESLSS